MIHQKYEDVVTPDLLVGNLDHDAYEGFLFDYRALHCLLRKHNPASVWECGTNVGSGMNVIYHAVPEAKLFSIDLDFQTMKEDSAQYPIGSEGEDRVGSAAFVPFTQIRGDSKTYDYSHYPCEAYWIDSEHNYETPFVETMEILSLHPKIIIYHDFNISEVKRAVLDAIKYSQHSKNYQLYRVDSTRIAYLKRKD